MTEPSLALQGAIVAAIEADPGLSALIGDRVFDRVPDGAPMPYVRLGDDQVVPDRADCLDAFELYATLHVWSAAVGRPEAKRIVAALLTLVDGADLDLGPDLALVLLEHGGTRYLDGDDPLTTHAVVTLRALVDRV